MLWRIVLLATSLHIIVQAKLLRLYWNMSRWPSGNLFASHARIRCSIHSKKRYNGFAWACRFTGCGFACTPRGPQNWVSVSLFQMSCQTTCNVRGASMLIIYSQLIQAHQIMATAAVLRAPRCAATFATKFPVCPNSFRLSQIASFHRSALILFRITQ